MSAVAVIHKAVDHMIDIVSYEEVRSTSDERYAALVFCLYASPYLPLSLLLVSSRGQENRQQQQQQQRQQQPVPVAVVGWKGVTHRFRKALLLLLLLLRPQPQQQPLATTTPSTATMLPPLLTSTTRPPLPAVVVVALNRNPGAAHHPAPAHQPRAVM